MVSNGILGRLLCFFSKMGAQKNAILLSMAGLRYSAFTKVLVSCLLAFAVVGCVSTPEVSSLPPPDITSADIDNTIRRPVPVYEFPNANQPADEDTPEGIENQRVDPLPLPPTYSNESTSTSRTVISLLNQANRQQQSGSPERAAATLERALRIEPKNARLWHRLAQIRFQQGQYKLAESLAAKSSTLARGDWHLKQKNAELIEQVKERKAYIR